MIQPCARLYRNSWSGVEASAGFTAQTRREIALYISRGGEVLDIAVGQKDNVPLADLARRRSEKRLSRVRCIHTHPSGQSTLSDVDISALKSLRLDAICALGARDDGGVAGASVCYLVPDQVTGYKPGPIMATGARALSHPKWMEAIAQNDRPVMPEAQATRSETERAYLIGIDSEESLDELASLAESAGVELHSNSPVFPDNRIGCRKYIFAGKNSSDGD